MSEEELRAAFEGQLNLLGSQQTLIEALHKRMDLHKQRFELHSDHLQSLSQSVIELHELIRSLLVHLGGGPADDLPANTVERQSDNLEDKKA